MIKLFKSFPNFKKIISSHKRTCVLTLIGAVFLGTFFAFRTFGKSGCTVNFLSDLSQETNINDIADIKIFRQGAQEPYTLVGNSVKVSSGENIVFRVYLKEGYEAEKSEYAIPVLSAHSTKESADETCETALYDGGYFEWCTDNIKSSRNIRLCGIKARKLSASLPCIVNEKGAKIKHFGFPENWDPVFDFNTKYKFKVDTRVGDAAGKIKNVSAKTVLNTGRAELSSDITELSEGIYEITLHDENSESGGIKGRIENIEVMLENGFASSDLILSLAANDPISVNFKGQNSLGETVPLTGDQMDIYVYVGDGAPSSPWVNEGQENQSLAAGVVKVESLSGEESSKFMVYESALQGKLLTSYIYKKDAYNNSGLVVKDPDGTEIMLSNGSYSFLVKEFAENPTAQDVVISNIEINRYPVSFVSGSGEGYNLNERADLYDNNDNLITNWSDIKINHGSSAVYKLKPKFGYTLADAAAVFSSPENGSYSYNNEVLTITVGGDSGMLFAMGVEVYDVKYIMYEVVFEDGDGNAIESSAARITAYPGSGTAINSGYSTSADGFQFKINLSAKYSKSTLTVTSKVAEGEEKSVPLEGSVYTFSFGDSAKGRVVIKIQGLEVNKYAAEFSSNFEDVKAHSYILLGDDPAGQETRVNWNEATGEIISHGENIVFTIKVDSADYKIDINDIQNLINSSTISGISGVSVVQSSDGLGAVVTLGRVSADLTERNSIQIGDIKQSSCDVVFNIIDEVKNYVKIYPGTLSATNYFYMNEFDPVFDESKSINSYPISGRTDVYIAVELLAGAKVQDQSVTCIEAGSGSQLPVVNPSNNFGDRKIYVFCIPYSSFSAQENISINILGIRPVTQSVNFNDFTGAVIKEAQTGKTVAPKSSVSVDYGSDLRLILETQRGFSFEDVSENIVVEDSLGKFVDFTVNSFSSDGCDITLINITSDLKFNLNLELDKIPIDFTPIEGAEYRSVTKTEDKEEYTLGDGISGTRTAGYGSTYYFAVKAARGYNIGSCVLTAHNQSVPIVDYDLGEYKLFKLENVETSTKVTGTINKIQINIMLTSESDLSGGDGKSDNKTTVKYYQNDTEVSAGKIVCDYGNATEFKVSLEEKCSNSDLKVNMYNEQGDFIEELPRVNELYKIVNITENRIIKVENLSWNKYVLNFMPVSSADYFNTTKGASQLISGTQNVIYGSEYSFKVQAKTGYVIGDSAVVNSRSASGITKELKQDSLGNYKFSNITENYTIMVENIENIEYTVSLLPAEGVSYLNEAGSNISGNLKIKYGKNFEFAVSLDDAYDDSMAGMYIIVNGGRSSGVSAQKLSSGRYVISNITEDISIKVGNVSKNRYTVNLTKDDGMDYYSVSHKIITGENEVLHGESLLFRVKLYPAYVDSKIKVMLGNKEITPNEENVYTVEKVLENKTVTVVGIEQTPEAELVNTINGLPVNITDTSDMDLVLQATRAYNSLDESKKSRITNYNVLQSLQEKMASYNHVCNDVSAQGLDWNIRLIANPISFDKEACTRIYEKLSSEYILSLYDVYLWDTVNDRRYTLPEGQNVVVTLPTPNMQYFESPTGIHEKAEGELDFLSINMNNKVTVLQTSSFSPIGIVAKRSSNPGRSSLVDAVDANVSLLTNYALGSLSNKNGSSKVQTDGNSGGVSDENNPADASEDYSNKFKGSSNITSRGSAFLLILIIMILILIGLGVKTFIDNKKNKKANKK